METTAISAYYRKLARRKGIDASLQFLLFLIMILGAILAADGSSAIIFTIAWVSMALSQCISTVYWIFILARIPKKMPGGVFIRWVFVIEMALLILLFSLRMPVLTLRVLYTMIVAGPVSGLFYFVITIAEISFYHKRGENTGYSGGTPE